MDETKLNHPSLSMSFYFSRHYYFNREILDVDLVGTLMMMDVYLVITIMMMMMIKMQDD